MFVHDFYVLCPNYKLSVFVQNVSSTGSFHYFKLCLKRPVESLKIRSQSSDEPVNLPDVMSAACSNANSNSATDAPLRFIHLVDAFHSASAGDLDSLYKSLAGMCVTPNDLDARRTFLDALIWCGTDDCVNIASELLGGGDIEDDMLESWLFSFTLNPKPTAGMVAMVAKGKVAKMTYPGYGIRIQFQLCYSDPNVS